MWKLALTSSSATAPVVTTGSAGSVSQSGASVAGSVNPSGSNVTDCHFDYGTSSSYGSRMACASSPGGGSGVVGVSALLSGLSAGTVYHFRVVATNAGGDQTFTTSAPPTGGDTSGGTSGGGTSGGGASRTNPPPGQILFDKVSSSGPTATLTVTCASFHAGCAATVKLTTVVLVRVVKHHRKKVIRKVIVVGTEQVNLSSGRSAPVKLTLIHAGERLLAQHHVLHSTLVIVEGGGSVVSRGLTFRPRNSTFKRERSKKMHAKRKKP